MEKININCLAYNDGLNDSYGLFQGGQPSEVSYYNFYSIGNEPPSKYNRRYDFNNK